MIMGRRELEGGGRRLPEERDPGLTRPAMSSVRLRHDPYTVRIRSVYGVHAACDELFHVVDGTVSVWRQEGIGFDGEEVPALPLALELGGKGLGVDLDGPLATVHLFNHVDSNTFCGLI